MTGLIHVYTGNGKGKTTAALGLSFRALGKGFTVYFIQFMKGSANYGEIKSAKNINGIKIYQFGREKFVDKINPDPLDISLAKQGFKKTKNIIETLPEKGKKNLLVMDELNVALDFNLLSLKDVLDFIEQKPSEMELVITGRNAKEGVIEKADYVTEMKEIKHPFMDGITARDGIEM